MNVPVIVITGAGAGIGRATALLCAESGFALALIDRAVGAARGVARDAEGLGSPTALALPCDVSDEDQVQDALRQTVDRIGAPTGLLANAGIEVNAPAHQTDRVDWDRVLAVNLTGVFLTCKHTLAAMLAAGRGGAIVCTSSPSAFVGFAGGGNGAYGASKGGISAFVRSLALDYAPFGIRVNAVVPGGTDTDLLHPGLSGPERAAARERVQRLAQEQVPLGRLGQPREIAHAVRWLLSPEASYVTGAHLVCDGGLLAKSANTF